MQFFAFLLKMIGWKVRLDAPLLPKCVFCIAPHTSNWDFVLGSIYMKSVGGHPRILMKKSWFIFPFNLLLRALGCVPVDRDNKHATTKRLIRSFEKKSYLQLAITPEGTRKRNAKWKTGFYHIAVAVSLPISVAYIDYKKKIIGILENFTPTGNKEQDVAYIKSLYKGIQGRHPEQFAI
jgi:1-acyl-sn-glycerol-3-phosphate acyltransferase